MLYNLYTNDYTLLYSITYCAIFHSCYYEWFQFDHYSLLYTHTVSIPVAAILVVALRFSLVTLVVVCLIERKTLKAFVYVVCPYGKCKEILHEMEMACERRGRKF